MTSKLNVGVQVPEVLLPNSSVDLNKWAVIACDQFTSQIDYWQQVARTVGDAPSTFHMILPEVYLNSPDVEERIRVSQETMQQYLDAGLFEAHNGFVLVERKLGNGLQTGLIVALDLEAYDFNKGSQTLIRATEGTILDRLPPRMKVRRGASIELPHILVLYDDPNGSVLADVQKAKSTLPIAYDFELMAGSGHLKAYLVEDPALTQRVTDALGALIAPETYAKKYNLSQGTAPLLFAMGDGNHSLATAKAIWEEMKSQVGPNHPARYALVELVNLHDASLRFEAIHRVLFHCPQDFGEALIAHFSPDLETRTVASFDEMAKLVFDDISPRQRFGMISSRGYTVLELTAPKQNLAVGNLQEYLDTYLKAHPEVEIDYVHGDDVVDDLGQKAGNVGFYLAPISKDSFFKTVIVDGALPRKTFSMGHAKDKRFYMECRRIKPQ